MRAVWLGCLVWCVACGDDDGPVDASGPCAVSADCDDRVFCNGLERCDAADPAADVRGCVAGLPPCEAGDSCDEETRMCASGCVDADGDGSQDIACGGDDCNDADPSIFAGATEVCDLEGVDEDCDPTTFGDRDIDGDRFIDYRCCNGDNCGADCDETRPGTNPVVPEVCDGRDNDCDGNVDEELLQSVFIDADRDLHGDASEPTMACPGRAGTSASSLDCDDTEPYANTPQREFTDGADNDCDGTVDENPQAVTWYIDADGDGFGDPDGATLSSDEVQPGYSLLPFDCDDSDEDRSPLATELCNGIDDDCDGQANLVLGVNDWEDDDGDGYPDASCATGATADCDDTDPNANPDHAEVCDDYRDNDCDGSVDEGCGSPVDMDGGMPMTDGGGTIVTDGGGGEGPNYCEAGAGGSGSPDGSGTYLRDGSPAFTVNDGLARWTVTGDAGSGYTGSLEITLSESGGLCWLLTNNQAVEDTWRGTVRLQVFSMDAPPTQPGPGTYGFVPFSGTLVEDVPALRPVGAARFGFYGSSECSGGAAAGPGESPTGSITLTTSTASSVVGSFSYDDDNDGTWNPSGTFDVTVREDCPTGTDAFCCQPPPAE